MRRFIENCDTSLKLFIVWLAVGHANIWTFAAGSLIIIFFLIFVPDWSCVFAKVMIGHSAIGFGGLVGLIEKCKSVIFGLV